MPYISTAERVGLEKGLAQGLAKGREEGREEGLLAGIEVALRMRFGEADATMMSEIRQLGDASLLRTILDAVPRADTPQSLRPIWFKP